MNKDNAKEFLPLVQALADGKTIQINNDGTWRDAHRPTFSQDPERYRIKPEPRKPREWVLIRAVSNAPYINVLEGDFPLNKEISVREILPETEQ